MVDRIDKVFGKMSSKEYAAVHGVFNRILRGDLEGLDMKKLHGWSDAYRVREGNFRIIFRCLTPTECIIVSVARRSDTTYRR